MCIIFVAAIRNCKFKILDAVMATEPIHRGGGQVIPTSRRVAYSAFLMVTLCWPSHQFNSDATLPFSRRLLVWWNHTTSLKCKRPPTACLPSTPSSRVVAVTWRKTRPSQDRRSTSSRLSFLPLTRSVSKLTFERTRKVKRSACQFSTTGRSVPVDSVARKKCSRHRLILFLQIVPGDPLDKSIMIRPLEAQPATHLAREFMIKTRRRKVVQEMHFKKLRCVLSRSFLIVLHFRVWARMFPSTNFSTTPCCWNWQNKT